MKRLSLRTMLVLAMAGSLSACANGGPLDLNLNLPAASSNPSAVSTLISGIASLSRQRVKVVFYNRLSNNELVPLVPDALDSLRFNGQFSLDAANFPRNKGLEQTFPFIEAGEHILELSFQDQDAPVMVPIVVPRTQAEQTVILVILAFDAGQQVRDVEVGYDQNSDLKLDRDMNIYRSNNGRSYLLTTPDGQVQEWNSPLQRGPSSNTSAPSDAPLPPGSDTGTSPGDGAAPLPQDRNEKQTPPPPVDVPVPDQRPLPLPDIGRG